MKTFKCAHCGVEFSRNKSAKYCSSTCSGMARKSGSSVACAECGKPTYLPINRLHRGTANNFCSKVCHDNWQSRQKVKKLCKVCGVGFLVSPSFAKAKYCSIKCRNNCEDFKRDCWLKNNLELQKRRPTKLEIEGRRILESTGIAFSEQVLFGGKFAVDVMLDGVMVVIQWDGDYWHGFKAANENKPADKRVERRVALDISQDAYMKASGYAVLRFWEHEVMGSPDSVRARIREAIRIAPAGIASRVAGLLKTDL